MRKPKVGSQYWYRLREVAREEAVRMLDAVNMIRPIRIRTLCMEGLEAWTLMTDEATGITMYTRVDWVVHDLAKIARDYQKEDR